MMKQYLTSFLLLFLPNFAFAFGLDVNTPKTITASEIEYDIKSNSIKTIGGAEIKNEDGNRITLTDSYISNKTNNIDGYANNIELWIGESGKITADKISTNNKISTSENTNFTMCEGCDDYGNAWEISSSEIVHNAEKKDITFYNSLFWVYDIPVLWLPYLSMSDGTEKYKTGLLTPSFQSTNNMGTQFNFPIYVSISDTHDLTFTPSYLSDENPLFQIEHRLNKPHSNFFTNGSFTRNLEGDDRWFFEHKDTIELGEHMRASIFIERTSDTTYLQKYGFYNEEPYLDSGAKLEFFRESGYINAETHIYQELRDINSTTRVSGNVLPNIYGTYQTLPFFYDTYAVINGDILNTSNSTSSSQRFIGESRIISPWTLLGGTRLTLDLSARYDLYNFNNTEMADGTLYSGTKARFLPSGSVEFGLPMLKTGDRWTQILEPKISFTAMQNTSDYIYAKDNDSSAAFLSDATLFSDNRFSGLDLWENGTFADYGIGWTAFDNNGHNIDLFAGQSYNFTEILQTNSYTGFNDGQSDYVGHAEYRYLNDFSVYNRFRLSQDNLSLQHSETSLSFGDYSDYLKIGHIWNINDYDPLIPGPEKINQLAAGFGLKVTNRVGVNFEAIYNINYGTFQKQRGRLYYSHPCYFVALEYERDNAIKEDYVGNTTFGVKFGIPIDGFSSENSGGEQWYNSNVF